MANDLTLLAIETARGPQRWYLTTLTAEAIGERQRETLILAIQLMNLVQTIADPPPAPESYTDDEAAAWHAAYTQLYARTVTIAAEAALHRWAQLGRIGEWSACKT